MQTELIRRMRISKVKYRHKNSKKKVWSLRAKLDRKKAE